MVLCQQSQSFYEQEMLFLPRLQEMNQESFPVHGEQA